MSDPILERRTIIVPEALIGAANAALGLSILSARWEDMQGHRFGAASFLAAGDMPESELPMVTMDPEAPLELHAAHVMVVKSQNGASVLAALGLFPALPYLG